MTSNGIQRDGSRRSGFTGVLPWPPGSRVPIACSDWRTVGSGAPDGARWTAERGKPTVSQPGSAEVPSRTTDGTGDDGGSHCVAVASRTASPTASGSTWSRATSQSASSATIRIGTHSATRTPGRTIRASTVPPSPASATTWRAVMTMSAVSAAPAPACLGAAQTSASLSLHMRLPPGLAPWLALLVTHVERLGTVAVVAVETGRQREDERLRSLLTGLGRTASFGSATT